jgi:hypothetical protein
MRASIFLPKAPSRRLDDEMAEHGQGSRAPRVLPRARTWDAERVASVLGPRRDELVERLPRELASARGLSRDEHETVIDEAIDFMVTEYDKPIADRHTLDRAFWATAAFRVRRVHEGRSNTVRAGWGRIDIDDVDIAAPDDDPVTALVHKVERGALLEFAATLTDVERQVLACKYGDGPRELGWRVVAHRLGLSTAETRRTERSIRRKLDRYVAILSAGSLCAQRTPGLEALAAGLADGQQERVARLHLSHCAACRAAYAEHLRALRSGDLQHRIAELLPLPAVVAERRHRGGPWETIADWAQRPFTSETVSTATQLAAGARGLGAAAAAKLATLCIGGALAVGGATFCATTLLQPDPPNVTRERAPRASQPTPRPKREQPLPSAGASLAAAHDAASRGASQAKQTESARTSAGTGGAAATQHERDVAISAPVTSARNDGSSEFAPAPVQSAPTTPAAAPAAGGAEFP